ncbi:MAG: hypothetical protein JO278_15915 [Dyella sp.]|nr:hypothetical protein [Dyella sp.]
MATSNDFLPFAVGGGANVLTQAQYAALASLLANGFSAGVAPSVQLNKVWRQSSIMAAVLGQFAADYSGQNSVDDGTTATLEANLVAAIRSATKTGVVLADTGAANAYTATNVPALVGGASATWVNGVVQQVNIAHANTGPSTYAPDGLPAIPIFGLGLQPLQGGELAVGGTAVMMKATIAGVNSGNPICVLMECAGGAQQSAPATQSQHATPLGQLFPSVSASVASNALTLSLAGPTALPFRNPTLTNGAPVVGPIPSTLSLTVPSGATLGTVPSQQATLVLLVAYNAGSPVLCVANLAGGLVLDETNLISPTAISSGATSASTIYSASAVAANSAYRIVGMVLISEANAGTWATAPTLVQGAGGQALSALSSIGYEQTWQNMSSTRLTGTTYYNTTGRPILVNVTIGCTSGTGGQATLTINGVQSNGSAVSNAGYASFVSGIVPPGGSYVVSASGGPNGINAWNELR